MYLLHVAFNGFWCGGCFWWGNWGVCGGLPSWCWFLGGEVELVEEPVKPVGGVVECGGGCPVVVAVEGV